MKTDKRIRSYAFCIHPTFVCSLNNKKLKKYIKLSLPPRCKNFSKHLDDINLLATYTLIFVVALIYKYQHIIAH